MLKKIGIIILLGFIVVVCLSATKVLNIVNIEENDRNVDSYHDFSAWLYTFCGFLMLVTAWMTFRFHIGLGILQYGLGGTLFLYGLYILSIKLQVI